jgi:hypothetical protein
MKSPTRVRHFEQHIAIAGRRADTNGTIRKVEVAQLGRDDEFGELAAESSLVLAVSGMCRPGPFTAAHGGPGGGVFAVLPP